MPTPTIPSWVGHYLPTRTPFISPLPWPDAPGVCSVQAVVAAADTWALALALLLIAAAAFVVWCSLRQNNHHDE